MRHQGPGPPAAVLTVGHSDRPLGDFLRLLRAHRVTAEAVPWRCHRSLIADALVVRGIPVMHILSASRTRPHLLRPWAHVEGTRVTYPAPAEGRAPTRGDNRSPPAG
jgi:hypothetical protein